MEALSLAQIISAGLGATGLGTTITLWILGRGKKGIGYEVGFERPLIEKKLKSDDELEIRYAGKIVEDPRIVLLRVCNAERGGIDERDFIRPIVVSFGDASVLSFDKECKPDTLDPKIAVDEHEVTIAPLHLNAGAEIVMSVIVSKKSKITCSTLVKGGVRGGNARELSVGPPTAVQRLGQVISFLFFAVMAVGAIWFFGMLFLDFWKNNGLWHGLYIVLVLVLIIGGMAVLGRLFGYVVERRKWPDFMR